jgi:iron complex transport system substrate-binding protein
MIPDPRANRIWRTFAILSVLAVAILACTRASEPEHDKRQAGKKIISIGGAVTETAFALGAGDEIIAVDTSSVYPPEAFARPKVGYQRTLGAEGILALQPTLVIASKEAGPPAVLAQLRNAGVRVEVMPDATDIDSTAARILAIGAVLDRTSQATALADQVKRDTKAALARVPADGPTFVMMFARGAGSMMAAGSGTSGEAMIALAGGKNAVSGFSGYKPVSAEALIAAAPDVIVVPAHTLQMIGGIDGVLKLPGVAETPAGRNRRIVAIDDLLLLGFGPRLAAGIDDIAKALRATPSST